MAKILFHPFTEEHLPLLRGWLRQPHVAEFWQETENEAELREKYISQLPGRSVVHYVIEREGRLIGFIQSYEAAKVGGGWWPNAAPGTFGVDQFLGEADSVGRGIGTEVIRSFVGKLFENPAVSEIICDPDPGNGRALRAYEKVGFLSEGTITTPGGSALLLRLTRNRFFELNAASLTLGEAGEIFRRLFQGYPGFWCVAGGWALDLFLGRQTRPHHDLEVVVLRGQHEALYAQVASYSPHLIFSGPGSEPLFQPWAGGEIPAEVIQVRLFAPEHEPRPFQFDLLLSPSEGQQWICRRDESIRLPLESVRKQGPWGIPFLAPEIVLLFKAKRSEAKDLQDLGNALGALSADSKEWLARHLALLYPEHPWLSRF